MLHKRFNGKPEDCAYRDVIAPAVYGLICQPSLRQKAEDRFPAADLSTPAKSLDWINDKPIRGYQSNLTALFLWYAEQM